MTLDDSHRLDRPILSFQSPVDGPLAATAFGHREERRYERGPAHIALNLYFELFWVFTQGGIT